MVAENQGPTGVSGSGGIDVPVIGPANSTNYCAPTATNEATQPTGLSIGKKRGGFAAALWARTPIENTEPNKTPVSLTPSSDPRPNDRRVFSPKDLYWTEKDWPVIIGKGEVANWNGTPYTPDQQVVLRNTMEMLRIHSGAPSPKYFTAMDPGEQKQTVKKFLGTKSLAIFIRDMNTASQARISVDSAVNQNPVWPVAPPPVQGAGLQGACQQNTTAQANAATSPGKFNKFLETRNGDAQVLANEESPQRPPATRPVTGPITVGENGTPPSEQLDVSGDQFFQLLSDYYGSAPATYNCDSDNNPADLRQHVSFEGRRPEGWERMARENSDLRNLVHQLQQVANRQTYVNKMNHMGVLESPPDLPVYHARHAAYLERLTRHPEDPPMFPAPEVDQEPAVVPLSIAHVFQDLMQIITGNEALISSFQKQFKCFVAAHTPAAGDNPTRENYAIANQLVARMVQLKKENEEMGKLIGCGMKGNMLAIVREEELNGMRKVIQDLQEQIKNTCVDNIMDLVPGELVEMNNENQTLREEICRLKMENARLNEQQKGEFGMGGGF